MFFLEFPSFLCDPDNVGTLISGSSSFSKPSLDIWKFLVRIMLKPPMENFKHDLTSWKMSVPAWWLANSLVTTLLGNWDEDWPFPVLWPLLGHPDMLTYWMQHLDGIREILIIISNITEPMLWRAPLSQSPHDSNQLRFPMTVFLLPRSVYATIWRQWNSGSSEWWAERTKGPPAP